MKTLMIYGATGYTGRMAAEHAKQLGLNLVIAGRNAERLASLAAELDVPYRVFAADASQLQGIDVLLNFAGPFAHTAEPLMRACMASGTDYLDITAEINVYRLAEQLGAWADVMLLPGVGWDVVPTDCLAMHVAHHHSQAHKRQKYAKHAFKLRCRYLRHPARTHSGADDTACRQHGSNTKIQLAVQTIDEGASSRSRNDHRQRRSVSLVLR